MSVSLSGTLFTQHIWTVFDVKRLAPLTPKHVLAHAGRFLRGRIELGNAFELPTAVRLFRVVFRLVANSLSRRFLFHGLEVSFKEAALAARGRSGSNPDPLPLRGCPPYQGGQPRSGRGSGFEPLLPRAASRSVAIIASAPFKLSAQDVEIVLACRGD